MDLWAITAVEEQVLAAAADLTATVLFGCYCYVVAVAAAVVALAQVLAAAAVTAVA